MTDDENEPVTPARQVEAPARPVKKSRRRKRDETRWPDAVDCALTTALAGCGSSTPPPNVVEARSAISAAEAVGAQSNPAAALHLQMAKDQVRAADELIGEGDREEARLVLDRAEVDAELAQVLTRKTQMRARAQEAQRIQRLQQSAQP